MAKADLLTKTLTIVGALLVWFPILAPVLLGLALFLRAGVFRFDYLLPAELFPSALLGGLLLIWASFRAYSRRALIGWSLGAAIALFAGSQALAVVTGLASGAAEPTGWRWLLVVAALVIYVLAVVLLGISGLLLLGDLVRPSNSAGESR